MRENPVRWFEIYVQDMPRAKQFYEAVFQVELQKLTPIEGLEMWGFPMGLERGASGALVKMPGIASGGNSTLVYFGCEDCAIEAERVLAAGGQIFREKMPIGPYGFIVLAIDSESNMIGLHSVI